MINYSIQAFWEQMLETIYVDYNSKGFTTVKMTVASTATINVPYCPVSVCRTSFQSTL